MSKRDKIAKIKEYIKNLVVQELNKEEELEEVSTTATAGIDGTGTGHYDTPMAFSGKSKKSKKKKKKISHASGMKPVNESQPFADFTQFPKLSRDQQESLDELFGFAESYQIYNAFENNPKKFIQTLNDMAKIRKASNKKPKGVNFNKGKKQFVKEIANQEISALQNVEKGLKKLQQDYIKITKIGDKTLRNRQYNDYYEYIIGAKEGIGKLIQTLKRKQMLGEGSMDWEKDFKWANEKELKVIAKLVHMNNGIAPVIKMSKKPDFKSFIKRAAQKGLGESINEGRYHTWRNDESLTAKQKIGRSIREVRNSLTELDKTVKMAVKLKTELNMKSEDYWKNTHKALTKISERLVKMANKVGNLK